MGHLANYGPVKSISRRAKTIPFGLEDHQHNEKNVVCEIRLYNFINLCGIILFLCAVVGYAFCAVLGHVCAVMESVVISLYVTY